MQRLFCWTIYSGSDNMAAPTVYRDQGFAKMIRRCNIQRWLVDRMWYAASEPNLSSSTIESLYAEGLLDWLFNNSDTYQHWAKHLQVYYCPVELLQRAVGSNQENCHIMCIDDEINGAAYRKVRPKDKPWLKKVNWWNWLMMTRGELLSDPERSHLCKAKHAEDRRKVLRHCTYDW